MTFTNLLGGKEANTQNTEEYKSKISDYMAKSGYFPIKDSAIHSSLPDLVLKRPNTDGDRETWVESKFDKISLTNKDFLTSLCKYFLSYMSMPKEKRFHLFIFIRDCVNQLNWKKIFDPEKLLNLDIENFRMELESSVTLELKNKFILYSYDEFQNFLSECEIVQADYQSLLMKINILDKSKIFDVNMGYINDKEDLVNEPEEIVSNIIEVTKLPDKIWLIKAKILEDIIPFWDDIQDELIYPHGGMLYSLVPPDTIKNIGLYGEQSSTQEIDFDTWFNNGSDDIKVNIVKTLIKKQIIKRGKYIKLKYYDKLKCLFYHHLNLRQEYNIINGRMISRVFYFQDNTSLKQITFDSHKSQPIKQKMHERARFVEHYGVKISIKHWGTKFYVIFNTIRLFTEDGKFVIEGDDAKRLHYQFPPIYEFNNTEKSKFLYWMDLFSFQNNLLSQRMEFHFSNPLKYSSPVKSQKEENFKQNGSTISTLLINFKPDGDLS